MHRRLFLLLACAPAALSAQAASYSTIETAPPADFGAAPPGPDGRQQGQASHYAQAYGVSEEEAQRRMRLQHEIAGEVGRIREQLETEQRGNYADLWLEHSPEWRMVVGFRRDPETTLRRYRAPSVHRPPGALLAGRAGSGDGGRLRAAAPPRHPRRGRHLCPGQ